MTYSIVYCGDTALHDAAQYLGGLMAGWKWSFDYVPNDKAMPASLLEVPRSLLILSDYPSSQFDSNCQKLALQQIESGCGLLMIGGWYTFHGLDGNWESTSLSSALPVEVQSRDDRVNFDQSAWLFPCQEHAIIAGLPWKSRPPAIGGMNQVVAKADASVLLRAHSFSISSSDSKDPTGQWSMTHHEILPALVVGKYGRGRTAAFMSDVAPHWVGGFVDWGLPRVTGQAPGAPAIEVGSHYNQFWKQLLEWTASGNSEMSSCHSE